MPDVWQKDVGTAPCIDPLSGKRRIGTLLPSRKNASSGFCCAVDQSELGLGSREPAMLHLGSF